MSDMFEKFNSIKSNIIKLHDFMVVDKNLTNFTKSSISISNYQSGLPFGINTEEVIINMLSNETNQNLTKSIFKKIFETPKFDFLDLRPDGTLMNGWLYLNRLVEMIIQSGYKNLVTTSLIASELQDSQHFTTNGFQTTNLSNTSTVYSPGKLSGINIYVDPFMKFNDGRICLFDDVYINYQNLQLTEQIKQSATSPSLQLSYEVDFVVKESKLIFVIENENSDGYNHYKSLQRDIKIDNILDK